MKQQVTISIDTDAISSYTDTHLATLWHVAQANPAPIEDADAGALVEKIGREIIRRFLVNTQPELYHYQGEHHYWWNLTRHCRWNGEAWAPKAGATPQKDAAVIIYGPQGSGKSHHAAALARHYGKATIIDHYDTAARSDSYPGDALVLTTDPLAPGAIDFDYAMRAAGLDKGETA